MNESSPRARRYAILAAMYGALGLAFWAACPGQDPDRRGRVAVESSTAPRLSGKLEERMAERLALMHQVARWKWNHGKPIEDPAREQALLETGEALARELGLEAALARRFLLAQFAAARAVQAHDFERWRSEGRGSFPDAPDLATEIRPRIETLTREMLVELRHRQTGPRGQDESSLVAPIAGGEALDPTIWAIAIGWRGDPGAARR